MYALNTPHADGLPRGVHDDRIEPTTEGAAPTMTESLTDETIAAIVQHVEPAWDLKRARPSTAGGHIVYHLDVATGAGTRQCILKATPTEQSPTCDEEARLLAILDRQTELPVPEVLGVIDEHEQFPTPLLLTAALPGGNYDRTALADFEDDAIRTLARSTGQHLAELHAFDAVDAYGFVGVEPRETLDGGRPSAGSAQITVQDPAADWPEYLDSEASRVVPALEETRFGDLAPSVRPVLEDGIEALTGPFEPVIGRIDQSLDNVIVDPESTAVRGLLDWEFCVAVTRVYDLAFVEHSLSGGHWSYLPELPDHRETIHDSMIEGYCEVSQESVGRQVADNYDYYRLLAEVHSMCTFESWFTDLDIVAGNDEQLDAAAAALRTRVAGLLDAT